MTWQLNGGAWPAGDNHATQVVKGGALAEPAEPVKAGSEFEGWYKEAALTSKVSFPYDVSAVTANITLYAKWEGVTEEAQLEVLYFYDNAISPIESFSFSDDGEGGLWDDLPFIVRTNQPSWEATSDQTWCTIDYSSEGLPAGEEGFFLYFEPYTGDFDREVTITITAGNAEPVSFSMTQKGKIGYYIGTWRVTWEDNSVTYWEQITISADKIEYLHSRGYYCTITGLTWIETDNPGGNTDNFPEGFRVTGTLTVNNGYYLSKFDGIGSAEVGDIVLTQYYIYVGKGSIMAGKSETETIFGPYHWKTDAGYWQVAWELNGGEWPANDNHATQVAKDGILFAPVAPAKADEIFRGWYSNAALTNAVSFPYDVSSATGDLTLYAKWYDKEAMYYFGHTLRLIDDLNKGLHPSTITGPNHETILSVSYYANYTVNYINFITAITAFGSYSRPALICSLQGSDANANAARAAHTAITNGSYDFVNDPANVIAYFGTLSSPSEFNSLSKLRLVTNNPDITEQVFNGIYFQNAFYNIIIYGKNKNGVLIGKYVGFSLDGKIFNCWHLDPEDPDFGKVTTLSIPQ